MGCIEFTKAHAEGGNRHALSRRTLCACALRRWRKNSNLEFHQKGKSNNSVKTLESNLSTYSTITDDDLFIILGGRCIF